MKRLKKWFLERFLPMWAKETVLHDNRCLLRQNEQLQQKNKELCAYIDGIHAGIKRVRVYTKGDKI